MADLTPVIRALVDAAFSTGGITDAQHEDLLGQLDAEEAPPEPDPAPEPPAASPPVTPEQPPAPEQPAAPVTPFGQEANPYA